MRYYCIRISNFLTHENLGKFSGLRYIFSCVRKILNLSQENAYFLMILQLPLLTHIFFVVYDWITSNHQNKAKRLLTTSRACYLISSTHEKWVDSIMANVSHQKWLTKNLRTIFFNLLFATFFTWFFSCFWRRNRVM